VIELDETTPAAAMRQPRRRWLNWVGTAIGLGLIALLVWRLDWRQFAEVLQSARPEFVLAAFLAITLEQVIRGWKWRQILTPVCDCRTSHLFGATMAGYLADFLVPLGLSPFVRSWLVARKQNISMSCVLATVAIDRLIDGLVFAGTVVILDNLSTHKSPRAAKALKQSKSWFLFLPPYSPDLNPIEQAFSKLKTHLRRIGARTYDDLITAIGDVCALFDPTECWNFFEAVGYASD